MFVCVYTQDVIEIAREVLYDKFGTLDDTVIATTDYREGSQAKGRGKKAEAQRFLKRVRQVAAVRGQDVFPMGQLCAMANEMALKVCVCVCVCVTHTHMVCLCTQRQP